MFTAIGLLSGGLVEVALPTLVHSQMHGGANGYGIILAGWSGGALVGSVFAGMLGKLKHKGIIIMLAGLIVSAAIGLLPIGGVIGAAALMLFGGVANSVIVVLLFTVLQLSIPAHLMGRVMGLLMFSSTGLYPVSVALTGVLTSQFGSAILFPFGGLLLGLVMLFGITQKAMREM